MSPLPAPGGMQGGCNPYLFCLANGLMQNSTLSPGQRDAEQCSSGIKVHGREWKQMWDYSKEKIWWMQESFRSLQSCYFCFKLLQEPTRQCDHRLPTTKCYSANPNNPSRMLYQRALFSVCAVNNL